MKQKKQDQNSRSQSDRKVDERGFYLQNINEVIWPIL